MCSTDIIDIIGQGNTDVLLELRESEGDDIAQIVTLANKDGKVPAEIAAIFGQVSMLNELLNCGANLHEVSSRGYSLLHYAAMWGHLDAVKQLVDLGINLLARNTHQETARDCAIRYQKEECALYLHKAEAFQELQRMALSYKDIIADPEKNMGRFNKDDKVQGNRNCDEKLDWIENNRDLASLQQILDKQLELREQLKPTLDKLSDECLSQFQMDKFAELIECLRFTRRETENSMWQNNAAIAQAKPKGGKIK